MLCSIVVNYIFSILIDKYRIDKTKTKLLLIMAIAYNISIIFIFKYLMFFMNNVKVLTGLNFAVPIIRLPIGISFFTFHV